MIKEVILLGILGGLCGVPIYSIITISRYHVYGEFLFSFKIYFLSFIIGGIIVKCFIT